MSNDPAPTTGAAELRESLENAIAFSARDYGLDKRDAWIYGIVFGWEDALPSIAARHGWSAEDCERLERLHAAFVALPATPVAPPEGTDRTRPPGPPDPPRPERLGKPKGYA